jgi:hypothetical protein
MADSDEQLQALIDEWAIVRTMHRYCRALDRGLPDEWSDIFTDDAVFDTVLPDGRVWAHLTTRDEFGSFLGAYPRQPAVAPKHIMVDPIVELDGLEASVESAFLFLLQTPGQHPQISAWGRYRDRFRKVDGQWRICERVADTEAMSD